MLKEAKIEMIISLILSLFLLFAIAFSFYRGYELGKEQAEIKEVVKYVEVVAKNATPTPPTQDEQIKSKWQVKSLGVFTLTAYDPCNECSEEYGNITATGVTAKEGRTIAVDPSVIPYGAKVIIDGFDEVYTAEDCGAYIKGNKIDIFFDSHAEVEKFGKQQAEVFLLECTE